MMLLDRYFLNYDLTMEEELCAEEPLGPSTVAHGDCKQQQTTVCKNNNTANAVQRETKAIRSSRSWEDSLPEYVVLTGSYVRRTLESSSCCRDTADNARESGSGPRGPKPGFHTPNTSDVLHHTRTSCRSGAKNTHLPLTLHTGPAPPRIDLQPDLRSWALRRSGRFRGDERHLDFPEVSWIREACGSVFMFIGWMREEGLCSSDVTGGFTFL